MALANALQIRTCFSSTCSSRLAGLLSLRGAKLGSSAYSTLSKRSHHTSLSTQRSASDLQKANGDGSVSAVPKYSAIALASAVRSIVAIVAIELMARRESLSVQDPLYLGLRQE